MERTTAAYWRATVAASAEKVRALALALLTFGSLFAGVAAFSGVGAAANTAQLDFSGIYDTDVVRGTADATDADIHDDARDEAVDRGHGSSRRGRRRW